MAVEKRKYKNRTTYRAYWRNPWTEKIEKGPARESLKEARKDDAEIKIKLEYEPEYFLPDGSPLPGQGTTFYHLSQVYLARSDIAESTRKEDFYHLARINPILGELSAAAITRDDLKEFEKSQRESGLAQSTVQRRISIIRAILNWAVESGMLSENPVQGYRCKGGSTTKLPPPSPSEVKKILAVSPPHLVRAILLSYYLGVRVGQSELLALRWSDYDAERQKMRVWSAMKNKDRPWRDVDISSALLPLFLEWLAEDARKDLSHLITYKGKPIISLKKAWWGALKKAGIARRIRLYDLRHAFATEAIAAGADIKAVADIMGHSSTAMIHKHYQHVVDEQKKKVVQSIPDVLAGVQQRGTKQMLSEYFSYPEKIILQ